MLDRLYRFSTELVSRSMRRRLLACGAFAGFALHNAALQADELDAWRSSFYRGWQTICGSGGVRLPDAYRFDKELRVESADELTTVEAPSSRRPGRLTAVEGGERLPLRLMPRDVNAVYLDDSNTRLVWEPQRPPYPSRKVVRSRHVESTEPSRAHDPDKVRMPVLTSAPPRSGEFSHIVQTSNEVAVEMEPTEAAPAPADEAREDQAKTIVDLMKKFGGALDGTEFDSERPFDLGDGARRDAEAKSRERLKAVREAVDSAERTNAERGVRLEADVEYFTPGSAGIAKPASNEQAVPQVDPRPGEPKRLDMHVMPVPAQALPEGVVNPDAAAEALRAAAEQLEHAANALERQSLYERADQLRDQAHQLRVDARGLKQPRTAIRPAAESQEKRDLSTSDATNPASAGVSPTFLQASYEEIQGTAAPNRWAPRRGPVLMGLIEMVTSAAANNGASPTTSTERLLAASSGDASAERSALMEQIREWERATAGSSVAYMAFTTDRCGGVICVAPTAQRAASDTIVDALDRMSDLLEGTAFEGKQHAERREEERQFKLRRGFGRWGEVDSNASWAQFQLSPRR